MAFIFQLAGDGIRIMITGGVITGTMIPGIHITGGDTEDGMIHIIIITDTGHLQEEVQITGVILKMPII